MKLFRLITQWAIAAGAFFTMVALARNSGGLAAMVMSWERLILIFIALVPFALIALAVARIRTTVETWVFPIAAILEIVMAVFTYSEVWGGNHDEYETADFFWLPFLQIAVTVAAVFIAAVIRVLRFQPRAALAGKRGVRAGLFFLKICVVAVCLLFSCFFLSLGWLLFAPHRPPPPDWYVGHDVVSPFPPSLKWVKTISLFHPTLGDGECNVAYTISAEDFELILKGRQWSRETLEPVEKGSDMERINRHFISVWPGVTPEPVLYHTRSEYPGAQMLASPDHTKVIFDIHD